MTPDEHADWLGDGAEALELRPCVDCPGWWAAEQLAAGMCNGRPGEAPE